MGGRVEEGIGEYIEGVCVWGGGGGCSGRDAQFCTSAHVLDKPEKEHVNFPGLFGPLDQLPWRVVRPSVRPSIRPSVCNVWIFFKIGGNIPWENIFFLD